MRGLNPRLPVPLSSRPYSLGRARPQPGTPRTRAGLPGDGYSRFRMFLLSSSSTAGLWLSRLRKNTRITLCTMVAAGGCEVGVAGAPSGSLPPKRRGPLPGASCWQVESDPLPARGGPCCHGAAGAASAPRLHRRLLMARSAPSRRVLGGSSGRAPRQRGGRCWTRRPRRRGARPGLVRQGLPDPPRSRSRTPAPAPRCYS